VCWFVSYPMDIVKSLIQLQPYDRPRRFPNSRFFPDGGIISCSRHVCYTFCFVMWPPPAVATTQCPVAFSLVVSCSCLCSCSCAGLRNVQIWKTDGFMGFWRGLSPCLLRAFPANGAGFLAYELSWRVLDMLKLT